MRVLFEARPAASPTGVGRYTRTVAGLLRAGVSGHDCWTLGIEGTDLPLVAASPLEEEFELPALLERESIAAFHSPLFHLPAVLPVLAIVTIHDAIAAVRPELATPEFARLFERAQEAAERADAVVCPSGHAQADIVRALTVPVKKVRVVPETPAPQFRPVGPEARAAVRKKYVLEGSFVIIVGSVERRKNPAVILDALARLKARDPPVAVFVGPEAGFDLQGEAARRGVQDRVRHLGLVPDEDLVGLMNEALALVFPSLYEGFGLPVVEAFACGTPVIASNAASIPEVAGDGAILFDPDDAEALATAIEKVQDSTAVREDLKKRGTKRLERFSPEAVRSALSALYTDLERGAR